MFTLERWSDATGAQRRMLGLRMKDIRFSADEDAARIANTFVLTDFGKVNVNVYDSRNRLIRTIAPSWLVSGRKELVWDRRDNNGRFVAPGSYRYEVVAVPAYRDERTIAQSRFSLPMYYHEDCGSITAADDAHLVSGSAVRWGHAPSQTANEHPSSVLYRFTGLDPRSEYRISAEYVSSDVRARVQDMTVDGVQLHTLVPVTPTAHQTGYMILPRESYQDGEVTIAVNARGEGSAIVSQLWIKETGTSFSAQMLENLIPTAYKLEQNYPNPFNPATTIRYAIPDQEQVTLKVYDVAGREVATLVNDAKPAGTYEVKFDGRNASGAALSSGVYFYRIKAGAFSETRKFVLLK
jgi:hypothetical protein